jgi:pentatricopeptide repeat protein
LQVKERVRAGQPERAEAVMEVMRVAGMQPTVDAFESLVAEWAKARQWARMEATLDALLELKVWAASFRHAASLPPPPPARSV